MHIRALRALIREGMHMPNLKLPRRKFLLLAAGAIALALPRIARAQAYPMRPVRILVGFPAGGTGDIVARLIGQSLQERLGQALVVENRPGGGRQHRNRGCRARAGGRLHAPVDHAAECDQRDALREAEFQFHL
jgi:hypothetical protein